MTAKINVSGLLLKLLSTQIHSVLKSTDAVAQHIFLQVNTLHEIADMLGESNDQDMSMLRTEIQKVAASVGEEMQFQDATRQQLEHVLNSIVYFVMAIGQDHNLELDQEKADALLQKIRDGYVMESERKRHDAVLKGEDPDLIEADSTDDEDAVDLF